ncbi:MAG TPA: pilin [Patescibacteria group bacterium]|nr:pilin [Patescibacteria group bacterium]
MNLGSPQCTSWTSGTDPVQLSCLGYIFINIVNSLFYLAGAAVLFIIIYGGYLFVTSIGNPQQVERAKHTLTHAFIGLGVILLSWVILRVVAEVTGSSDILTFPFS